MDQAATDRFPADMAPGALAGREPRSRMIKQGLDAAAGPPAHSGGWVGLDQSRPARPRRCASGDRSYWDASGCRSNGPPIGPVVSHRWMAGVLLVEALSRTRCTSRWAGTSRSMVARNLRNSMARVRECSAPMTLPLVMPRAAYRLEVRPAGSHGWRGRAPWASWGRPARCGPAAFAQ